MRAELYFLSSQKNRPSLFGMPLIVPCTVHTRTRDLYDSVWTQVSRLASPLPPQEASNHAQDWSVSPDHSLYFDRWLCSVFLKVQVCDADRCVYVCVNTVMTAWATSIPSPCAWYRKMATPALGVHGTGN